MRAGDLRHKIIIQVQNGTTIQDGLEVPNWIQFRVTMAAIEPIRGRELFAAETSHSEISTRIRTRYMPGVKASMRIISGATTYDIETVINLGERNRELELMCKVVE